LVGDGVGGRDRRPWLGKEERIWRVKGGGEWGGRNVEKERKEGIIYSALAFT
jgi:hypothetical protein